MRDILFRGKKTGFDEWVQGYITSPCEKTMCFLTEARPKMKWYVDADTVGQYTGLTDKNGNKIFEGDVCQTKGYKLIDETPFIVVWNDYYSGFYWEDVKNANDTDMFTKTVAELTEVIGNIHDNPELLKGGD